MNMTLLSSYSLVTQHSGLTLPIPRRHVHTTCLSLSPNPLRLRLRASSIRRPYRVCASAGIGDLLQDAGATSIVLAGAYGLVLGFDSLSQRNLIQQSLSRKLVHILSGLLFMVSWPIFSTSMEARYFAALVPLVNCLRLVAHGLSLVTNDGLVKSVTRQGNPQELLRGPLYYVLILTLCAVIFWRESPVGVISMAMMCAGDGIADIMGRRFGSMKIFYNQKKSWAGSISMFVFGFLASIGMLYYFSVFGYFQLDWVSTVQRVALVSLVATVVESFSTTENLMASSSVITTLDLDIDTSCIVYDPALVNFFFQSPKG